MASAAPRRPPRPLLLAALLLAAAATLAPAAVGAFNASLLEPNCGKPAGLIGGFVEQVDDNDDNPYAEALVDAAAANATALPLVDEANSTCTPDLESDGEWDESEILQVCTQVVAGTNAIVAFEASVDCPEGSRSAILQAEGFFPLPGFGGFEEETTDDDYDDDDDDEVGVPELTGLTFLGFAE